MIDIDARSRLFKVANSLEMRSRITEVAGELLETTDDVELLVTTRFQDRVRAALSLVNCGGAYSEDRGANIAVGKTVELLSGGHRVILNAQVLEGALTASDEKRDLSTLAFPGLRALLRWRRGFMCVLKPTRGQFSQRLSSGR